MVYVAYLCSNPGLSYLPLCEDENRCLFDDYVMSGTFEALTPAAAGRLFPGGPRTGAMDSAEAIKSIIYCGDILFEADTGSYFLADPNGFTRVDIDETGRIVIGVSKAI